MTDAIAEAEGRLAVARAVEAENAARAKAQQVLETCAAFRECGVELGHTARALGETSRLLIDLLTQLHAAGIRSPRCFGPSSIAVDARGDTLGQALSTVGTA